MNHIAIPIFALGIVGLFMLNRDRKAPTSMALLIPFVWLLIAGSRNLGEWLQMGGPANGGDPYLEGNPLDRNLLSALIALGVVVLFQRRKRVGAILQANAPIIIYFLYCCVSILWSDYPFVGLKRWIRSLGDVVMILIVLTDRDRFAARRRLYAWVGFLVLPISILLIRFFSELGRSYSVTDGQAFWTGVTTNKNELGMICMIFGLAAESNFLDALRNADKAARARLLVANGAIVVVAIYLLYLANSATSLGCLLIGSCVLGFTSWPAFARKPALVHLLVAALLCVSFSALFLNLGSSLVEGLGRNSTLTGRTFVWTHVQQFVDNPLFGAGFESFWIGPRLEKMRAFAPGLNQAHNGYIEIYLNLGWVGVVLLATIIVTGYRNVIAMFRRNPYAARLSLTYFVVALAYNFTEGAFKMRSPVWISFLMAIMAVPVLVRRTTARPLDEPPFNPRNAEVAGSHGRLFKEYV